ncbi:MAG: lipoyl synthase [Candidatus Omnitrophica bacterium]|nr:lipoyl synthase [Candidatus Omnitrophota bacterium]
MRTGQLIERPSWLKKRLIYNGALADTRKILSEGGINTVCASSVCPNQNECFANSQATFLLLGEKCTRSCAFCNCGNSSAGLNLPYDPPDPSEPERILSAVKKLGLRYVVLTSVTRDDLADGGAGQFAATIRVVKSYSDKIKVEVLTPDFKGDERSVGTVAEAGADVFAHNIETVESLYSRVRPGADYGRSLKLLKYVKKIKPSQLTKASIMVGLGEDEVSVLRTIKDIAGTGCDILTIGQYLSPGPDNAPVAKYVTPQEFERYKEAALRTGLKHVAAGPFVRSSYLAETAYKNARKGTVRYDRS